MGPSWMFSCFSCFFPRSAEQDNDHGVIQDGVEREMKICQNQPHLVQPMKLRFYDEIPESRPWSSSRFSQRMLDVRNRASRASSRASMKIKKRTSKQPQIGLPSDFRRIDPPRARVGPFRPLELSIYLPGNRLSPLHGFDDFDIDYPDQIRVPDSALIRSRSDTIMSQTSGSFQIPRKPVASMVGDDEFWCRGLTFDTNDRHTQSRPSFCESTNSQHIPSREDGSLAMPSSANSEPTQIRDGLRLEATLAEPFQDTFNPILEEKGGESPKIGPPTPSTLNLPLQAPSTPPATPPLPHSATSSPTRKRVTQWLLRSHSASHSNPNPFYQCSPPPTANAGHTRTISGSTVSTLVSASAPTLSSFSTQAFSPARLIPRDKEQEHGPVIQELHEHDALPSLPPTYEDSNKESEDRNKEDGRSLRVSAVGVAF